MKSIIKANNGVFQACTAPRAVIAIAFSMATHEDFVGYTPEWIPYVMYYSVQYTQLEPVMSLYMSIKFMELLQLC